MTAACRVDARFHQPPPELERFFTTFCFGTVDADGIVEDAMQPEWGTLRFFPDTAPSIHAPDGGTLSSARFVASGPSSQITEYSMGSSRFWGIGLLPLGWATFVGTPANEMANRLVDGAVEPPFRAFAPLAEVLLDPDLAEDQQLAFLTDFFLSHAQRHGKEDPRITKVHDCLMAPDLPDVQTMADHCAMGGRTLERLCRRVFGFPPKLLIRRQRFMRSLSAFMLDPDASWSNTLDALYYDQSHFVRESHKFLGMTPSEYAVLEHPILAGFMRDRAQIKGSAAQTLDKPAT
ncbi:AraC family transcriptional regulator [Altererythrobacter sp. RZ02]|uniref:AraC family transcriptional regulator n=1 Tax=Pontixanthobacter rizhaonensis TaxID=2730337 RepID=A0A848QJH9_9SPHN|nr:helix-turn-helix domain-containing protein [Pontixanthobacter rizhaonensis]NMW32802.1 AraC family transcriptional regulator [Pontixanthobacter rizhaonensis]